MNWYLMAKKAKPKKWTEVDSSFIQSAFYSDSNKELELKLKNGTTYTYLDVSRKTFDNLMNAESKGKFFNDVIKPKHIVKI